MSTPPPPITPFIITPTLELAPFPDSDKRSHDNESLYSPKRVISTESKPTPAVGAGVTDTKNTVSGWFKRLPIPGSDYFTSSPSGAGTAATNVSAAGEDGEDEEYNIGIVKSESFSIYVEKLRTLRDTIGSAGMIRKQGILNKCARRTKRNWKKRHFVLDQCCFSYFRDPSDIEPGLELYFDVDSIVRRVNDIQYGFEVVVSGEIPLTLSADNEDDRNEWILAIEAVIQELRDGNSRSLLKSTPSESVKNPPLKMKETKSEAVPIPAPVSTVRKASVDVDKSDDEDNSKKKAVSAHIEKLRQLRETVGFVAMIRKKGELMKCPTNNKISLGATWKKRLFILDPCALSYFSSSSDTEAKNEIFFDLESTVKRNPDFTYSMELNASGVNLICCGESENDINSWITAIEAVLKELKDGSSKSTGRKGSNETGSSLKSFRAGITSVKKGNTVPRHESTDKVISDRNVDREIEEDGGGDEDESDDEEKKGKVILESSETTDDKTTATRSKRPHRNLQQARRQVTAAGSSPTPNTEAENRNSGKPESRSSSSKPFSPPPSTTSPTTDLPPTIPPTAYKSKHQANNSSFPDMSSIATQAANIAALKPVAERPKPGSDSKGTVKATPKDEAVSKKEKIVSPQGPPVSNNTTGTTSIPDNWIEAKSDDGKIYYYHKVTRVVRWEKPEGILAEKIEASIEESEREMRKRQEIRLKEIRDEEEAKAAKLVKENKATDEANDLVKLWQTNSKGNIMALISNIHTIIPERVEAPVKLPPTASPTEVKKAYMQLVRLIHPDKLGADVPLSVRILSEKVFSSLTLAYDKYRDGL